MNGEKEDVKEKERHSPHQMVHFFIHWCCKGHFLNKRFIGEDYVCLFFHFKKKIYTSRCNPVEVLLVDREKVEVSLRLFNIFEGNMVFTFLQYDFSEVTQKKILLLRLGTTYHKSKKTPNRSWIADFSCSFHRIFLLMVWPSHEFKLKQCFCKKYPTFTGLILFKSPQIDIFDPSFDPWSSYAKNQMIYSLKNYSYWKKILQFRKKN